jgi:hypothetical protein
MAHCDEWTDWHLTDTGWIIGNNKTTFSDIKQMDIPIGRVLTKRYRELQTSSFSRNEIITDEQWTNGDNSLIKSLLEKLPFPNSL